MNLLLPLILYAVGVIGSIFFIKWRIQKTAFDMFPGGITKSLGEGANGKNRSKVKDLEKKPLDNPEVEDAKILSETTKFLDNKNKIPMFQSNRSQLPDFRDNKRQLFMMKNDDRPVTYNSNSDGKGSYATGIVQRGAIANATGIQHITGPLMQGGLVYNRKLGNVMSLNQLSQAMLNKTRGIGNINQMSQAVLNKTGGIRSINQNPQVMSNKAGVIKNLNQISQSTLNNTRRIGRVSSQGRTSISGPSGRINFRQTGRSYLYGNVNRAQLANGIVRTDRLQIKGFSKVETIIAKRFKDPSRRIAAFRNGIQGKNNTLTLGYRNRKIKKLQI